MHANYGEQDLMYIRAATIGHCNGLCEQYKFVGMKTRESTIISMVYGSGIIYV